MQVIKCTACDNIITGHGLILDNGLMYHSSCIDRGTEFHIHQSSTRNGICIDSHATTQPPAKKPRHK